MCPSKLVIFSEITRSKPFKMNKVINNAETPIARPAIDSILAVLKKPVWFLDLNCFEVR